MPHHSTSVPWPQVATVGRATSGLDACNPASHRMTSHLIPNTSGRQRWRQGNPSRRHIPVAVVHRPRGAAASQRPPSGCRGASCLMEHQPPQMPKALQRPSRPAPLAT
ncbi:hypothetical protein BDA96_10G108900 [Sorghum bicolor]|uniref:Uncharacterized protein n=1 Tax=Sorghum bicolor TaxID=4558 RepID=A0A921Q348_SORBI|nr:hypothetical protein BDA96_10G108900 [Sorghum bicolor]